MTAPEHDPLNTLRGLCDPLMEKMGDKQRLDMFVKYGGMVVKECERLRKLDVEYGEVECAIIMADPEFDGSSDHATPAQRLIASVNRLAKMP